MPPVLTCSAEIRIAAPPEVVLDHLVDLSLWPSWNTFIPHATIQNPSSTVKESGSQRMQVGQKLKFEVHFPILGARRKLPGGSLERVVSVDESPASTSSLVAWDQCMLPTFLLRTHRENAIQRQQDTTQACTYITSMTFDGPFAYVIKLLIGRKLQREFDEWAVNLKNVAEKWVANNLKTTDN